MLRLFTFLLLTTLPYLAIAQKRTVEMDDPENEERLNREIWESVKKTPYSKVLKYVKKAQAKSKAQVSSEVSLPNGWKIAPVGQQIVVGALPFNGIYFGGKIVVSNNGDQSPQSLMVIDPASGAIEKTVNVPTMFPGLTIGPGGDLYVSGGQDAKIYRYDAQFSLKATYNGLGYVYDVQAMDSRYVAFSYLEKVGLGGLNLPAHVAVLDTQSGSVIRDRKLADSEIYSLAVMAGKIYATVPAMGQVLALDWDLNLLKTLTAGKGSLATCKDSARVYVANQNSDTVSVIDAATDGIVATLATKFQGYEWGAAPSSCTIDGNDLLVTVGMPNAVSILDKNSGAFKGYIPAGWFPTKVVATADKLAIVSAKGIAARRPNPNDADVLQLIQGSVGLVARTDIAANLAAWTDQVKQSSPLLSPAGPLKNGIEHVFYIVKENRTYDQVLGDLPRGNGDPTLTIFGNTISPVQHYLATEFVTLDNLYVNGEVSAIGHTYTASGYASPYHLLLTNLEYSGRFDGSSSVVPACFSPAYIWDTMNFRKVSYRVFGEAVYLTGIYPIIVQRTGAGSELAGKMQYLATKSEKSSKLFRDLFDLLRKYKNEAGSPEAVAALLKKPEFGVPFSRFFTGDDSLYRAVNSDAGLLLELAVYLSKLSFDYMPFNLNYSDIDRVAAWLEDFKAKDAQGKVENFHYLTLPNDHTSGDDGARTPTQYIAQNDAALDLIIRTLTKSSIWEKSVVLVVEDDAQGGPDHVDSTRTTAYAAGPLVKRQALVSDRYDQISMLRTIGLIFGLNPIGMTDALAVPMSNIFAQSLNTTYAPPPVSTVLTSEDKARYDQVLATINGLKVK